MKQCLFGEHLISLEPDKPIAIVESEKSAIVASVYFPQYIWLACGGLSNLSFDKCKVLKGRNVILIPDLGGFIKWQTKAKELASTIQVRVSDILEKIASDKERQAGWDIADYLIAGRYAELSKHKIQNLQANNLTQDKKEVKAHQSNS